MKTQKRLHWKQRDSEYVIIHAHGQNALLQLITLACMQYRINSAISCIVRKLSLVLRPLYLPFVFKIIHRKWNMMSGGHEGGRGPTAKTMH